MPPTRYGGPLANMPAQGVRSLWIVCDRCHHEAVINVDRFGDDVPVPAFGPRMVCTSWGIIGAFAPAELAGAVGAGEFRTVRARSLPRSSTRGCDRCRALANPRRRARGDRRPIRTPIHRAPGHAGAAFCRPPCWCRGQVRVRHS
jgi:hypothetical protein